MTGFRASTLTCALAAFAAVAWSVPSAVAQSRPSGDAPIQLVPPGGGDTRPGRIRDATPERQRPVLPTSLSPLGRSRPEQPRSPSLSPDTVVVNPLNAIDPESIGTMDEATGGLPLSMWSGTDRTVALRLVAGLPAPQPSPSLRALTRMLLLTRAAAPRGEGAPPPALVAARVERLMALGDQRAALALIEEAPRGLMDGTLAEAEAQALFLDNNNTKACSRVEGNALEYQGPVWQQALAFCVALSGQKARATMIADLLRERGAETAPSFYVLVDALGQNADVTLDSLPDPNGLTLAMVRAANARLPVDALAADRPASLRAIALSPNAELPIRLAAAERAAAMGAIDGETMADIYNAVEIAPTELLDAEASAQADWGPDARALLLRAASARASAADRAQMLAAAWRIADGRGDGAVLRRASLPLLRTIEPHPDLSFFAPRAAETLIAAGSEAEAMGWLQVAEDNAPIRADAAAAERELLPFATLTLSPDAPLPVERMFEWLNDGLTEGDATAQAAHAARAARLFAALEAMGRDVPADLWAMLAGRQAAVPASRISISGGLLRKSVAAGRMGETVAVALMLLGGNGLSNADPERLYIALSALMTAGLQEHARRIAVEAVYGAPGLSG